MGGRPLKMYSLLKSEGPALSTICGGVIGGGDCCCVRKAEECNYTSHQIKAWEAGSMEPGMYILDGSALKAFLEPCLPMRDATQSVMERAVLEDGKQTMEAWTAIFRHLQEVGTRGDEEGREDPGLRRFTTAMKTPRGQVNTDLLNSTKRLHMTKEGDDESFTLAGISWELRRLTRLVIPAGILRIPVFSSPEALVSQDSRFLFLRNF